MRTLQFGMMVGNRHRATRDAARANILIRNASHFTIHPSLSLSASNAEPCSGLRRALGSALDAERENAPRVVSVLGMLCVLCGRSLDPREVTLREAQRLRAISHDPQYNTQSCRGSPLARHCQISADSRRAREARIMCNPANRPWRRRRMQTQVPLSVL